MTTPLLRFSLLLLVAPAFAQGTWSDAFARPGIIGRVFALDSFQSELVAGGSFGQVTGELLPADVLRFDGRRWHSLGGSLGVDGRVRAFATFQGELVAGGQLTAAGGQPIAGVARWNGTNWRPLGAGVGLSFGTSEVFALAVYQNELYAGGFFDQAGGQPITALARWNGSFWQTVGAGLASATSTPPSVYALKVGSDGRLYVGGDFVSAGGVAASNIGSWDGSTWRAVGSTLTTGGVRALEEFQGQIHAGGDFNSIGGVNAERIARWNGTSWSALGGGLTHLSILSQVFTLREQAGSLLVGGKFDTAGTLGARNVARWDGGSWHAIGGVGGPTLATTALASTLWNGRWVVGGEFMHAGATTAAIDVATQGIAAWNGSGWEGLGEGLGSDNEVNKLVAFRGGVVALGRFNQIGSVVTSAAAFFDGVRWQPMDGTFDAAVLDAVEYQGNLVVVGQFTTVGGQPVNGVAQWNGTAWQPMGTGISLLGAISVAVYQNQLYVGGYGPPVRWTGSAWQPFGTPVYGATTTMVVHNGLLYLGGDYNVAPSSADVLSWDGSTLRAVGGNFDLSVTELAVFQNQLLVGGWFTSIGGTPARRLASWNGVSWSEFGGGFAVGAVEELIEFGGLLVMAGNVGGANVQRWNGSSWSPLTTNLVGAAATLLADEFAGHLWLGGNFLSVQNQAASNVARYELRPGWENLGGELAGAAGAPVLVGQGALNAGADVTLRVQNAPGATVGLHVFGFGRGMQPLLGGTLVPRPEATLFFLTDALGVSTLALHLAFTLPSGTEVVAQSWLADATGPQGVTASNAIAARAP